MSNLSKILKSDAKLSVAKQTTLNLLITHQQISEKYTAFFKEFDLSGPQFNVLRILRGQKGNPANLSTIQERMVQKNSNVSRIIDKLIVKQLVERTQCPENRRKIEIIITSKGLDLLNDIDPKLEAIENEVLSPLTQEEALLLNSLLEKLRM